jgi:hypothetical protein
MATKTKKASVKKKMQTGGVKPVPGMKKNQAKAEEFYDKNPSVRTYTNEFTGKKIPTGPMTKKEYQNAAERAAAVYDDGTKSKPSPMLKKGGSAKMKMGGAKKPKMMSGGAKPKAMYGTSMKSDMMKKGGVTASATGYKKQMGGPASSKSCRDGKCAPGMRGTKGIGKPKSTFSKKKFSV